VLDTNERRVTDRQTDKRTIAGEASSPRQQDRRPPISANYCDDGKDGVEYCDENVCLAVCLSLREHISGTTCPIYANFCEYYLWPWLGPSLTTLRYVILCTSGVVNDVMFSRNGQK